MKHFYFTLALLLIITITQAQNVNIPDANFKNALINQGVDTNNDSEIQVSEALTTTEIDISNMNVSDLTGIEEFSNIEEINASSCLLTSLSLTNHPNLEILLIQYNQINSLNLSNVGGLTYFVAHNNQLTNIELTNLTSLDFLDVRNNQLSSIDISNNTIINQVLASDNQISSFTSNVNSTIEHLDLANNMLISINLNNLSNLFGLSLLNNNLTSLDINNPNLFSLDVSYNQLSSITFNDNNIEHLNCSFNSFTELDLSNMQNFNTISQITINNNPNLQYINLNNGRNFVHSNGNAGISFSNNPSLEFVCLDSLESPLVWYVEIGSNAVVTEYCSFTPGGDYFEISGNTILDSDNNGCDVADIIYPNLTLQISDDTSDGAFLSNDLGDYFMPIQAGNYTITPLLENPTYFTVSPTDVTVNFPTETSPYILDFCVTPNGVHNDLEIIISPLEAARPGFDTDYKLVYKNKGSTTLSGSVDLTYNDDLMDLLIENPVSNYQSTGNLSWDYTNLQPFETRVILFTMTLNTPTDPTFPLSGDDVLPFTATITPLASESTPDDNAFTLDQIVVNSFDPNDKTCLEGQSVTPEYVGGYVHYMIRFENTGTANAVNIVVKDVIDTTKYDLLSLIPLDASHNFQTRIRNENEVEFIFENIQLPFDDDNNDGYVLFKIKTLSTLTLGDSFTNEAEIYFDYNFPIITNNETTTIEENLIVDEFNLLNAISLYPNPSSDYFEIRTTIGFNIKSIELYDISGKMLKQFTPSKKYNINNLAPGIYFVKIQSNGNEFTKKIIKN